MCKELCVVTKERIRWLGRAQWKEERGGPRKERMEGERETDFGNDKWKT